jgi:hypothetical protein
MGEVINAFAAPLAEAITIIKNAKLKTKPSMPTTRG